MTRPLRYRMELGIGQWKSRPEPLTLSCVMLVLLVAGVVVGLALFFFNLEVK